MHEELWAGVEFKLGEAGFFLDQMGKVLIPARLRPDRRNPAYGQQITRWQPDFYYYLDAFLGAARSVPDVVQKCFGWDGRSRNAWPQPLGAEETGRRKEFQKEYTSPYTDFNQQVLSRVRGGTFHWTGVPPVQANAQLPFGQEFTGGPLELIPSAACRNFPEGTDLNNLPPGAFQSIPVDPSSQDFTFMIPQHGGSIRSIPLFEECQKYLKAAKTLATDAREICNRVHNGSKLTPPLAATMNS